MTTETRYADETEKEAVRSADETTRSRIWEEWVREVGSAEASRRWLLIFSATDASLTG